MKELWRCPLKRLNEAILPVSKQHIKRNTTQPTWRKLPITCVIHNLVKPQVTSSDTNYIWEKRAVLSKGKAVTVHGCCRFLLKWLLKKCHHCGKHKVLKRDNRVIKPHIILSPYQLSTRKDMKWNQRDWKRTQRWNEESPYLHSSFCCVILGSDCADQRHSTAPCWELPPAADMYATPPPDTCLSGQQVTCPKIAAPKHVCGR